MGCIHPKSNLRQEGEGPLVSSEVGTGTQEPWYQPIVKGRYQFHIFSLSHPLVPVCPVTQWRRVPVSEEATPAPCCWHSPGDTVGVWESAAGRRFRKDGIKHPFKSTNSISKPYCLHLPDPEVYRHVFRGNLSLVISTTTWMTQQQSERKNKILVDFPWHAANSVAE